MTREEKQQIDVLIDLWINEILGVAVPPGWQSHSLLARFMEYGCLPPTGNNNQADMAMIMAVEKMKNPHAHYKRIAAAVAILWDEKPEYMAAILAHRYYQSSRINEATGKAYTVEDRAGILNIQVEAYRYNLQKAYYAIAMELQRFDTYERIQNGGGKVSKNIFFKMVDKAPHDG